jgi:hypothetical protein
MGMRGIAREREKTKGLTKDTLILTGYQLFHSYIRSHQGLEGKTPAEACGITTEGQKQAEDSNSECKEKRPLTQSLVHVISLIFSIKSLRRSGVVAQMRYIFRRLYFSLILYPLRLLHHSETSFHILLGTLTSNIFFFNK